MSKITRKSVVAWFMPIIVSIFVVGCGTQEDPILGHDNNISVNPTTVCPAPTVVAVVPENNDTNVSISVKKITAEFSVAMDASSLNPASFTLLKGNSLVPEGNVTYANKVAELALTTPLSADTNYTVTISNEANCTYGYTLSNNYVWKFTTGSASDTTPPTVFSTSPRDGDINVSITKLITATFSEPMIPSSITKTVPASTFSVMETNTSIDVNGTITYSVINKIAAFKPAANLKSDTNYTAKITTVAEDLSGKIMASDYNWTFVTASAAITQPLVPLALASTYGIASTAGITNTITSPITQIDGDVVFNPTATCNGVQILIANSFGLCDGKAPTTTGVVITPNFPNGTTTAQHVTDDLRAAYLSITPANMPGGTAIAAGTTLGAPTGNALVEGDNLFYSGVYTSNTSILITGDLTLDANFNANATFVFQSASTIGTTSNARILLVNGAKASNVYWQAGSDATLGTNTTWNGNIFAYRDITMVTGASSCGRLFAGAFTAGAFVFDSNHVSVPGNASASASCK